MAEYKVIDVSKHNGSIDFAAVKASGIYAVIIRAGYGREVSQKDPMFDTNYAAAKGVGLHIGAYWYSYADSVADAAKEANACLACIQGKQFDFPVYYDLEEQSIALRLPRPSATPLKMPDIGQAFMPTPIGGRTIWITPPSGPGTPSGWRTTGRHTTPPSNEICTSTPALAAWLGSKAMWTWTAAPGTFRLKSEACMVAHLPPRRSPQSRTTGSIVLATASTFGRKLILPPPWLNG